MCVGFEKLFVQRRLAPLRSLPSLWHTAKSKVTCHGLAGCHHSAAAKGAIDKRNAAHGDVVWGKASWWMVTSVRRAGMGVRPANDKMGRRRTCGDWCKDSFKSLGLGREILVVLWCLSAGPPSARVCHGYARADAIRDGNRTETVGGGEDLRA
jgi:hypothetical protein